MTTIQTFQYRSGELKPYALGVHSIDEALVKAGRGIYTIFLVYPGGRVLRFEEHATRLRRSADILKMSFDYPTDTLREAAGLALRESSASMLRMCLHVSCTTPDTILLTLQEFTPPGEEVYQRGVRVALDAIKRSDPLAKDSSFISERSKVRRQYPGVEEVLMFDAEGRILEGLSSNFFAVMDGQLRTAGANILPGISRSILLEAVEGALPVTFEPIYVGDCSRISEAFLTSSSRGVIPVVEIERQRIGSGKPGPIYAALRKLFDERVEAELQPVWEEMQG